MVKIMNKTEFCEKIKDELGNLLDGGISVTLRKISKNNGIVLNGVVITKKGKNISPTIYLDEFYEDYTGGKNFKEIVGEVAGLYEKSVRQENLDMDFFVNYEKMKNKVAFRVIGLDKNKELLKEIPHIVFLDMAVVFYCCVPEEALERATILIYNSHLKMWGITQEILYKDAVNNTKKMLPPRLISMEKMMEEIFAEDLQKEFRLKEDSGWMPDADWFDKAARQILSPVTEEQNCGGMFVLGNEYKLFGAAVILYEGVLESFADKLEKDIFILPSSVHEVILVPDDGEQSAGELWRMVCDINDTQVAPDEVLTDSVYYYSRESKKIRRLF